MAHNIGQMFYFGNVPWHTLGNKLDHAADLDEALEAGGLDWTVTKVPIAPIDAPNTQIPHRVAVVRQDRQPGDSGRVVGVVHPGFEPLQNRQGAMILDALMGQGQPIYHTGGYLKNGEVIWLWPNCQGTYAFAAMTFSKPICYSQTVMTDQWPSISG